MRIPPAFRDAAAPQQSTEKGFSESFLPPFRVLEKIVGKFSNCELAFSAVAHVPAWYRAAGMLRGLEYTSVFEVIDSMNYNCLISFHI